MSRGLILPAVQGWALVLSVALGGCSAELEVACISVLPAWQLMGNGGCMPAAVSKAAVFLLTNDGVLRPCIPKPACWHPRHRLGGWKTRQDF